MKVDNERSKHTSSWPGTDLDGIFVAFRYIEFYEHTGTHVDAPIHFDENGKTEDHSEPFPTQEIDLGGTYWAFEYCGCQTQE